MYKTKQGRGERGERRKRIVLLMKQEDNKTEEEKGIVSSNQTVDEVVEPESMERTSQYPLSPSIRFRTPCRSF